MPLDRLRPGRRPEQDRRPPPDHVLRPDAREHARALRRGGAGAADQDRKHRGGARHRRAVGRSRRPGARLDVTASSIGDARSLQGGTLLPTPLRGPDGRSCALAQGPLSIGGFGGGAGGNTVPVNHLTVGRVPGGALVQVARQTALPRRPMSCASSLREPDFVTAAPRRERDQHGAWRRARRASSTPGTVVVAVPQEYRTSIADLIARLEPLPVAIDAPARVVINERTGTVVARRRRADRAGGGRARQPVGPRSRREYDVSQPDAILAAADDGRAADAGERRSRKIASWSRSRRARRSTPSSAR